ncbi:acetylxylan esterase [Paenibacillus sedimenti]|uniref:Acetylxylan esterase n=1 Tax=Paenibacillus sedimenti TaxID=2770274 RepID=A0A926KNW2_9BACL|nr:acetylxylan esterase [Paenibacillus sedimenti]MBD0380431.1 acetylxylan esterase [Paenibacillus sedimenti]
MNAIQKRIEELYRYVPSLQKPADLSSYWEKVLAEEEKPLLMELLPVNTAMNLVRAYKLIYEGYAQTPIHSWYLVPEVGANQPLPCIVMFHGYTGSKGEPEDYAAWLLMGYAVLAIDIRGQSGETGNSLPQTYGMTKGWITQGILDPQSCYYKALAIDAIRAIHCAKQQPEVDSGRIIAMGVSQGGGLALLTGALETSVRMVVAAIPNMCHMDFGLFNSTGSLTEIAQFVSHAQGRLDSVLSTLSYFDIVNLADRIKMPVWMSVGLKDTVCLPETVFAAYQAIVSKEKELQINPFLGHETVRGHAAIVNTFIQQHLG